MKIKKQTRRKINNQSGAAMLISVLFFLFISLAIITGLVSPTVREFRNANMNLNSKKSYFLAESGSEDAYFRIKNNITINFPKTLTLNNSSANSTVAVTGANEKEITSIASVNSHFRTVLKDITTTNGFNFSFAVQIGPGGVRMKNNSGVFGNIYSDGPIDGDDKNHNFVTGSAVSAGSSGSIDNIHSSVNMYANSITNSKVDQNAYYQNIDNDTTVTGTKYPNSADQPYGIMPISDDLLDQWENDAIAGDTISSPCPYNITTSVTLGPTKINCDVLVDGNNAVLNLTGAIWIKGQLMVQGGATIKVDDSVGNKSVVIIADDPLNRDTKGFIYLQNNSNYFGSTDNTDSYVMLVSRNNSAESGGNNLAIKVQNAATGNLLLYAPHGQIQLQNNVTLREVTGYGLTMQNEAKVSYAIGLSQPLFTTGPGGKWKIKRWKEIR
ncbi:MAG: hypothetical protein AAB623_00615 [Patescibacteria group bacterium]